MLARQTVATLQRPVIAAAVVPEWKKQLLLHWVAHRPEVDAIEIRGDDGQPPFKLSLPPKDIEANRAKARTRVLYVNTIQSPELERSADIDCAGTPLTIVLVWQGNAVSEPAEISIGAK